MKSRRQFIRHSVAGAIISATGSFPFSAFVDEPDVTKLTILHTNDMHSRIDPFPMDSGRNSGLGGVARRSHLISTVRAQEENVLLLDSGDIFQGTPYFNFFEGEVEIKSMTHMGYDIATMGNHDFDGGMETFEKQIAHADFDFVVSNYGFQDTILKDKVKRHKIMDYNGIKIGVFGIGIELDGLVPPSLRGDTVYYNPITMANKEAHILRKEMNCDYVICLSHLGYRYRDNTVSDIILANNSRNIDLILGGHTHTFLDKPDIQENLDGKEVHISQCGWAGIVLGRIEIYFERNKKNKCVTCKNMLVE